VTVADLVSADESGSLPFSTEEELLFLGGLTDNLEVASFGELFCNLVGSLSEHTGQHASVDTVCQVGHLLIAAIVLNAVDGVNLIEHAQPCAVGYGYLCLTHKLQIIVGINQLGDLRTEGPSAGRCSAAGEQERCYTNHE